MGYEIISTIEHDPATFRCSCCGSHKVIKSGATLRNFKAPGFALKRSVIRLTVQRIECRVCKAVRQVKVGFAEQNRRFHRQFERCVLDVSRHMTIQDVAVHFGVSWDVVKDVQKRYIIRKFSRPRLRYLRRIAIDEIYIGKKRKFLTTVLDLVSGTVVFVGEGKSADALTLFWKRLKSARDRIETVAIDMSKAYIHAATTNLPKAILVFDHSQVVKLFNEKLTDLRRELYREVTDLIQNEVLKGVLWLLLNNPENLNDKLNARQRLGASAPPQSTAGMRLPPQGRPPTDMESAGPVHRRGCLR